MALKKPIRGTDGVTTNYHRIMFLTMTTNRQNSIAVISYVDEQAREDEITALANFTAMPYKTSVTYETDYDQDMTIESAYEYLKTLPQFEGAEDI